MLKPVSSKVDFPKLEEEITKFWKKNKIFEKSVESKPVDKRWTFLDGPPFVTGMPHYGTLLSSLPKDVFGRYWTMKGYRVRRVWGWDGHGLPIENKVETKLNITRKKDIEEKIGIEVFINECKKYVNVVSDEWEWYVDRIGRWVDFRNAYKTWDRDYMESVMWVFKQMYDKGYIYKGLRVSLYCPHCATPISNFEVAMDADNYKEINDPASIYKYELRPKADQPMADTAEKNTFILAWSTTPWNKIVTPALAVNPELVYVKVKPHFVPIKIGTTRGKQSDEYYILAKTTLGILKNKCHAELGSASIEKDSRILKQVQDDNKQVQDDKAIEGVDYEIVEEFLGEKLIGKKFIPHYNYYRIKAGEKAFEIIGGDFVTAEEGTGVVTIAAYGEEDLGAMKKDNIHIELHLDEEGNVKPDVPIFGGMYYLKANKYVEEDLEKRGLIYKKDELSHSVPLCWRCHTRLYYAPQDAWFVDIQKLKPLLVKTNKDINWFPKHFKYGRFLKSIENAPDWNISRSRYWGSPVPVWECECGERFVPGSIKELEKACGQKVSDLHKPGIDNKVITCKKCGKKAKRVTEVLDSWIEAGSASFAERHFPFNPQSKLKDFFPPDFIAEYTGQIRAWFYVVHVIGAVLYKSIAFKNVMVEGVILGTDGRKMSKNYGNYPDPKEMLLKYGGDALRLYLLGSPVMHGEDIIISEEQYRNQVKGTMLLLWNVYNFFVTYANIDKWQIANGKWQIANSSNVLDQWILLLLNNLIKETTAAYEGFDTVKVIGLIQEFIDNLSKWYIRRSRDRVGPSVVNLEDKQSFYVTTFEVLKTLCKLIAPIAPFISEEIYKNLTKEESVHLAEWPKISSKFKVKSSKLIEQMKIVRKIAEVGHAKRKELGIKVRQPLKECQISNIKYQMSNELEILIMDELNVKKITWKEGDEDLMVDFDTNITPELKAEGEARDIVRTIQEERKKLEMKIDEKVDVTLPQYPTQFEEYIKRNAMVRNLIKGDKLQINQASE
jgi:isoleucyl-tRNA synthetase